MAGFEPLYLLGALLFGILIGAIGTYVRQQRRILDLEQRSARLENELELQGVIHAERKAAWEQARAQLDDAFRALAGRALNENSAQFLRLAEQNLKQIQAQANGELQLREKAVEELVRPIREALQKTEQELRRMENERKEAFGSLGKHLETLAQSHRTLQAETRNLVQALRRPEVRGQWGELTLRRVVELAGMVEHCDFVTQESVRDTNRGLLRPDMLVRMPSGRQIVVDAKTPLDAYLSAVETADEAERETQLKRHARTLRERVRELAAKGYWDQFENTPDFVVLFIPGDQFLGAALDQDHKLLEDAFSDRVVLATPTSLVALLRAVAYGWRQEQLAENAEEIRRIGAEMYDRLAVFSEHMVKLGRSLENSVKSFNQAVGSFDSRILPSARKFTELGISSRKEVPEIDQIEQGTRELPSPAESDA